MKRVLVVVGCALLFSACGGGTSAPGGSSSVFAPPIAFGSSNALAALPQHYTIVDLGADAYPLRINARDHVVGNIQPQNQNSTVFYYDGAMHVLAHGTASDINDNDVIVGAYNNFAAIFNHDKTVKTLPPPPGYQNGFAAAINDAGTIAGGAGPACPTDLVTYQENGTSSIVQQSAVAVEINASGTILYEQFSGNGSCSLGLYAPSLHPGGTLQMPSNASRGDAMQEQGTDVNASGDAVGWYSTADGGGNYSGVGSFYFHNGTVEEIDPPGGVSPSNSFFANALNAQGWIAGTVQSGAAPTSGASVWVRGSFTNLNALLPANCQWVLQTATDINDSGYVVGIGSYKGAEHGYLLVPRS